MPVHLVKPSGVSLGRGVITSGWLYVIATATPACYDDLLMSHETLVRFDPDLLTLQGLKSVFKDFESSGPELRDRLPGFRQCAPHVLGSFIFDPNNDR